MRSATIMQDSITSEVRKYKRDLIQEKAEIQRDIQTLQTKRDVSEKKSKRMENRVIAIDDELRKLRRTTNARFL